MRHPALGKNEPEVDERVELALSMFELAGLLVPLLIVAGAGAAVGIWLAIRKLPAQ